MRLRELGVRFVGFVLPVALVGMILGAILWVVMSTYFWDTSRLTLVLPTSEPTQVHTQTQARLIYWDFLVFGFPYSVHITLPWSDDQSCQKTCTFQGIPAGESVVTLKTPTDTQQILVQIQPATEGTIDIERSLSGLNMRLAILPTEGIGPVGECLGSFCDCSSIAIIESNARSTRENIVSISRSETSAF
jgi:hypothetical protein